MAKKTKKQTNTKAIDQRPFMGLRSFEEKNKSQFGGRDKEIRKLFNLIDNRGLTVVFGKSGIGKTSLLKAGLMPELRQNFYFPIYIRIDYSSSKTPLNQLRERVYKQMRKKDPSISEVGEHTLWDYFHNVNLVDGLLTPVLILDQFEETFTLGDANIRDVLEMVIELADLAENQIPLKVQQEYQKKDETIPSYYGKQPYRVVLSLREDYLARLEELKRYMPSIMDSRFRVVQMTITQALDAAIKPGKELLDEAVASEIIKKLPGVSQSDFDVLSNKKGKENEKLKVEPFLLSLICDRINEKRIDRGLETITFDLVSEFNVKDVIRSFYYETIEEYGPQIQHAIEDRLLTEGGFRKLQALEELLRDYDIEENAIDELVDARILRKEMRDGIEYVELIHDVLSPVIKEKRDRRIEREREEKRKAAIERARAKNRARISKIISGIAAGVGVILIATIWTAVSSFREKENLKEKTENMALARKLLFTSQSLGSYDGEHEKAALVARVAYLINERNKSGETVGENMYDQFFYNAMYEALRNVPDNRVELDGGGEDLKSMEYIEPNEIYVGLKDGTVKDLEDRSTLYDFNPKQQNLTRGNAGTRISRRATSGLYVGNSRQLKSKKNRVTSLAWYQQEGRNLLAMAGIFDSIVIYDLDADEVYKKISIPNSKTAGKVIEFNAKGSLVLNQRESLVIWEPPYDMPLSWNVREALVWDDSTKIKTKYDAALLQWGEETLKKPKSGDILPFLDVYSCFSIAQNGTIAIGTYGGMVLLNEDAYLKLWFKDIGTVSAVRFHTSGQSLILGNEKGEVFEMFLNNEQDYSLQKHQYQTEKIVDITYHPNDTLVGTASDDGTVVIWNRFDGSSQPALNSILVGYKNLGAVNNVNFTPDGDYILAGYSNGTILKWPIYIDKLANLICEEVDVKIDMEEWEEILDGRNINVADYQCKNTN